MRITLIGMSNIGKSYWARRLAAEFGLTLFDCDHMIEKKLAPELARSGFKGTEGMAKWMGLPFDAHYPSHSRKYMEYEKAVMQEIIGKLENAPADEAFVIDTTGSVIYAGADVVSRLKELTKVVYLGSSREHTKKLFDDYMAIPKPTIWNGIFNPHAAETPQETMKRCFPELLESRARYYEKMAHVIVPYELHKNSEADWCGLVSQLR